MQGLIQCWVSTFQKNPAVLLLTLSKELLISFEIEQMKVYVLFSNGTVKLKKVGDVELPDVTIKGNFESLESLLMGRYLLREMVSRHQISLHASFRKTLLLESLFQLVHSHFISESLKNTLTTSKMV